LDKAARLVADVGCGEGRFHLESALRVRFGGKFVGIDTDFESLVAARGLAERCCCQAIYVCASADMLPFKDGCFDQVFMVDILEHVRNDGEALLEGRRVLRVDGLLEISTPTPVFPLVFGRRFHEEVGHVRDGYQLTALTAQLKGKGFEVVRARQNTGLATWGFMALWYRLRIRRGHSVMGRLTGGMLVVLLGVVLRLARLVDRFGGYCTNDVEARRLTG
jgi:ubiquinone/menaquinone biosynthesis C-methylase UbiE